ncbi:MAG: hypothetical protein WC807_14825 [Hyphomicrobium sp.]|jgi:hypothetical protein
MNLMDLIAGLQQMQAPPSMPGMMPQDDMNGAPPTLGGMGDGPDMPTSGATDFSARGRAPISVPLPTQRPDGAPLANPADITAFAPTDIQRAQRGMPPIPMTGVPGQEQNSLLSAIAPGITRQPTAMDKAMASLGGGLSTVTGNTAGGAFARGMGGGLKAGTAQDKTDFDQQIKELAAVQKARESGDTSAYKQAMTNYYKVLATTKGQQAAAGGPAGKPPRSIDGRLLFDKAERALQGAYRAIDGDFRLKPEEKAARKAAEAARIYKGYGLNPDGTDAGGTKPGKVAGKPAAAAGSEISMQGDGTQGNAYAPNSKDDYDQIESGSYYIHPSSGEIRRKK